jgi:hypothetical protein
MDFLLEIAMISAKASRLLVRGIFLEIFKIHSLVWFFLWIFGCFLNLFHQCFDLSYY